MNREETTGVFESQRGTRKLGDELAEVLARLRVAVSDDVVRDLDMRAEREAQEFARAQRRANLASEGVALRPEVERGLVCGEGLSESASLTAVRRWMALDAVPPVLVLSGGTGSGKTVAAAWALANSPHGGRWRTASQLARAFAGSFGESVEEQQGACECRLLVLDDLGAETAPASRVAGMLVELLECRQRAPARTRTVVTTNLDRTAFAARYGDARLASRMAPEAGVVAWVSDRGRDLRSKKQ